MIAIGVQMESIVMTAPDRADTISLFEHGDGQPCSTHRCPAGKPRRARADDNGVRVSRHGLLVSSTRCATKVPFG